MDNLPPIPEDSIGKHFEAPIPRDLPLPKRCDHKGKVQIIPGTNELRCSCGTCWSGPNIAQLYDLLK
jgi:hypothetical protein